LRVINALRPPSLLLAGRTSDVDHAQARTVDSAQHDHPRPSPSEFTMAMCNRSSLSGTTRDRLVTDFEEVMKSAEALLTATANQSGEAIVAAREKAATTLHRARERLAEVEEVVTERTREAVQSGEHQIKAHPWTAVGVSAGVGLLLGLLIARR